MMIRVTSGIRLLESSTFRASATRLFKKNLNNLAKVRSNEVFRGYEKRCFEKLSNNSRLKQCQRTRREFSSQINSSETTGSELEPRQYDKISDETLDSLTEYFDELMEQAEHLQDADVSYGDGVLTIRLGDDYGTYVINRQTPNKQIWLSSPTSGPKRYDYISGRWIYKHDGKSLHQLLDEEFSSITKSSTNFRQCSYGGEEESKS